MGVWFGFGPSCGSVPSMRLRNRSDGISWLLSLICLIDSGCAGHTNVEAIPSDVRGLKELSQVYREFDQKHKRAPKSLKEMKIQGQRDPIAVTMINSGDLVVRWGAPLSTGVEASETVLAYVKTVPEKGGYVLMQDGKTIKEMTADEFGKAS